MKHLIITLFMTAVTVPALAQDIYHIDPQEQAGISIPLTSSISITYDAGGNVTSIGTPFSPLFGASQQVEENSRPLQESLFNTVIAYSQPSSLVSVTVTGWPEEGSYTIAVYDTAGQLAILRESSSSYAEVSLSDLSSGIYIIDVTVGGEHSTKKITKE